MNLNIFGTRKVDEKIDQKIDPEHTSSVASDGSDGSECIIEKDFFNSMLEAEQSMEYPSRVTFGFPIVSPPPSPGNNRVPTPEVEDKQGDEDEEKSREEPELEEIIEEKMNLLVGLQKLERSGAMLSKYYNTKSSLKELRAEYNSQVEWLKELEHSRDWIWNRVLRTRSLNKHKVLMERASKLNTTPLAIMHYDEALSVNRVLKFASLALVGLGSIFAFKELNRSGINRSERVTGGLESDPRVYTSIGNGWYKTNGVY